MTDRIKDEMPPPPPPGTAIRSTEDERVDEYVIAYDAGAAGVRSADSWLSLPKGISQWRRRVALLCPSCVALITRESAGPNGEPRLVFIRLDPAAWEAEFHFARLCERCHPPGPDEGLVPQRFVVYTTDEMLARRRQAAGLDQKTGDQSAPTDAPEERNEDDECPF